MYTSSEELVDAVIDIIELTFHFSDPEESSFRMSLLNFANNQNTNVEFSKEAGQFISDYKRSMRNEIGQITNTVDKAKETLSALINLVSVRDTYSFFLDDAPQYEAMVLLAEMISKESVTRIVRMWKKEAKSFQAKLSKGVY